MSRKIYLHIGTHKTGTTSIQKTLYFNKDLLSKNNLIYHANGDGINRFNFNDLLEKTTLNFDYGLKISNSLDRFDFISENRMNVIISGERFSFVFSVTELKNFKSRLSKLFANFEIIVYLRRQDLQAVSHLNQTSKVDGYFDNLFWGNYSNALPSYNEHFDKYLDYNKKLIMWSEVFGKENIKIRIFEKDKLVNGDVVADFFDLLGIKDFKNTMKINESNGLEKAKIGFLMNQANINNRLLRKIIEKDLDTNNKLLPKRAEAEEFYAQYRESNIALNKMFNISEENEAIFNEDFSMYPEDGNELWTEEIVNDTVLKIFKNLNESYGNINYNAIFQSAIKLEKIDLKLSYELMKILERLIPNDQNIKNKILSYSNFIKSIKKR